MKDYGVSHGAVDYDIDRRRDELLERAPASKAGAMWNHAASPGYMSDDEIRALFGALGGQFWPAIQTARPKSTSARESSEPDDARR